MRFLRTPSSEGSGLAASRDRLKRHDQQLIAKTAKRFLPSLAQLRFVFRFFNRKETWYFIAALTAVVIGGLWYSYGYIREHRLVQPEVGGEYREVIVGMPRLVNPIFSVTNESDQDLVRLIYSGLMRYDAAGALVPDLAESLRANTSSTEYTLALRPQVRWHDGTDFSADDVLSTIERIKDPAVGSPLRLSFQGVTLKKTDDHTVVFTLEKPLPAFPHALTVGILPRHIWNNSTASGMKLADANIRPIGTGPYQFSALTKNRNGVIMSYTLTRNTQFYRNAPYIETFQLQFTPDLETAIDLFKGKRVDGIHFIPKERKEELNKHANAIYSIAWPQYTALFFNQKRNAALEKFDVRKALAQAINKADVVQDGLHGEATPSNSPFPPGSISYRADAEGYPFDPAKASQILTNAGWQTIDRAAFIEVRVAQLAKEWKSQSTDGQQVSDDEISRLAREQVTGETPPSQQVFRKNKKGDILTVTLTTVNNAEAIRVAELIQSAWQAIGVHTILQAIDPSLIQSEVLKPRNFEVLLFGEVLKADYDPYPFWHSSQIEHPGLNITLYINRKADQLLEDARATTDEKKRTEAYAAFQSALNKDLPAIFLYHPKYLYVQNKKIQHMNVTRMATSADRFNEVESWYSKTKGSWK